MSSAPVVHANELGERVYGAAELAALLGVAPSAISNYRARANVRVPLPAPAYLAPDSRNERGRAYWTRAQVETYLLARLADARELASSAERRAELATRRAARARAALERAELAAHRIGAIAAPIGRGTASRASREST
jgi:hypothetical protein